MKPKDPQKIERIHKATLELVSEIGLAGLTMSKIGKKAQLGMGTIYTYFESKEEIINSLYQTLKRKHTEEIYANFEEQQSFLTNFQAIFDVFFTSIFHQEAEYFFLEQCRASLFLTPDSIALEESVHAKMNALLDEGKDKKIVKAIDNDLLIGYLLGGVQGFITQLKQQNKVLTKTVITEARTLCLSAIRQ